MQQLSFYGPLDHAMLSDYRVFVNPSISEVLCTAIAEVSKTAVDGY